MKYKNIGRCDFVVSPNLIRNDVGELIIVNCDGLIKHKLVVFNKGRELITRKLCDVHILEVADRYSGISSINLTFSCAVQSQRSRPKHV